MQYWKICKTLWKIFSSQYFLKYYHICIFTYVWGTSVTLNFLGVEDRTLYTGSNFSFAVGGVNQMWTTFPQIKRNTKVEEEKKRNNKKKKKTPHHKCEYTLYVRTTEFCLFEKTGRILHCTSLLSETAGIHCK